MIFWSLYGKNLPKKIELAPRIGSKFLKKYKDQLNK
jgi:hypothetical protein